MTHLEIEPIAIDEARRLAEPFSWTVDALVDKLPDVKPEWIREALPRFGGDRSELESRVLRLMEAQRDEGARTYVGIVLLFLGHPVGHDALLSGLRSAHVKARALALEAIASPRSGDFAQEGGTGVLGISSDRICEALMPMLQAPEAGDGASALDFFLSHASDPSGVSALLDHPDLSVQAKVASAFIRRRIGKGELTWVLALLSKFDRADRDHPVVVQLAGELQYSLSLAVAEDSPADYALEAASCALALLGKFIEVCEQAKPTERWIDMRYLLKAALAAPASAGARYVSELVGSACVPLEVRLRALLALHDFGIESSYRDDLIREGIESTAEQYSTDWFRECADRGLLSPECAVLALTRPRWSFNAREIVKKGLVRVGGQERLAPLVLEGMNRASQDVTKHELVVDLARTLLALKPSEIQRGQAIELVRRAAESVQADNGAQLRKELGQLLTALGCDDGDSQDTSDPWGAMALHWLRQGWFHDDIKRVLAEANLIDVPRADPDANHTSQAESPKNVVCDLFYSNGERMVFRSIRDSGFDPRHDEFFGELVASIRPPVKVEALSQEVQVFRAVVERAADAGLTIRVGDEQLPAGTDVLGEAPLVTTEGRIAVRFIFKDQVFRFYARSMGTWMDVASVLNAFEEFMAHIGRAERVFALELDWSEFGAYLCAPTEIMERVNARLRIPLKRHRQDSEEPIA